MTTHTNCTHPATKAARAACRKGQLAVAQNDALIKHGIDPFGRGTIADLVTKAEAIKASPVQAPSTMRYEFDSVTCMRCAGSGTYPSSAWNGVCLGCKGSGKVLTRAGKAARKLEQAFIDANLMIPARDVQPGMRIRPNQVDGWKNVVSIDAEPKVSAWSITKDDEGNEVRTPIEHISIVTQKTTWSMSPDSLVQRTATPEEYQQLVNLLARRKGAIMTPREQA